MSVRRFNLNQFIVEQGQVLIDAGIEAGRVEIVIILCHLLDCERLQLFLHAEVLVTPEIETKCKEIVQRRAMRYPLQYILEAMWFYGRTFFVSPAVMIPTPETELLCETAIAFIKKEQMKSPKILDIGTGSGVIAVTMTAEVPDANTIALDISDDALAVAKRNAKTLAVNSRIEFRQSDLFAAIKKDERFDLILSNPPYIAEPMYAGLPPEVLADPKISLTSGPEGMDIIKKIVQDAPNYLAPGGLLAFEIGYDQADKVANLTDTDDRYTSISILRDLNDIDRVVLLQCGI
jgi:release factor glutamine methyltransferase